MIEAMRKMLRFSWCLLIFMLPFKWCYAAVTAEHANFPLSALEWLLSSILPHSVLPPLAGLLLIASVLLWREPPSFRHPSAIVPLLSLSPLLFGVAGLINTTEWGYAINWYWHFYSAFAIAAGIWWTARHDDKLLPWLLNTIAVSTALTIVSGWRQRFGGQEAELKMQLEHAAQTGREVPQQLIEKMRQSRVSGNFSDPNIYAAHLLLTVPLLIAALCRFASRCAQPRAAKWLLCSLTLIFAGGALFFSGSRGAFLGLAAGTAAALWMFFADRLKRWQIITILAAAIAGCALLAVAASYASSRKMETVTVRMEYYGTALKIAARFPFAGAGLGEYFPWHMRLKDGAADEARDPHSLFFAMLSQCGIPGAIDALLRIGVPFILALGWLRKRRNKDRTLAICALAGWCAWNIHSLFQFNDMIIATLCHVAFIGLFVFDAGKDGTCNIPSKGRIAILATIIAVGVIGLLSAARFPAEKRLQEIEYDIQERRIAPDLALARLQDICEKMPNAPFPPRFACDVANACRRLDDSVKFAGMMTERTPHRASAWLRLAKAQQAKMMHAEAHASMETAQLWYPNSPSLMLTRGLYKLIRIGALPAATAEASWQIERISVTDTETHFLVSSPAWNSYLLPPIESVAERLTSLGLKTTDGKKFIFTTKRQ